MRGFALFVAGVLSALAVQSAIAQNGKSSPNEGIVQLNHVGLAVSDIDKAVEFYTKTMGFPEAYRSTDAQGRVRNVMVQISKNTFLELGRATAQRPVGVTHLGLEVKDMPKVTAMFKARGADVGKTNVGSSKNILSSVTDPDGIRMELVEVPADSLQGQAIASWR